MPAFRNVRRSRRLSHQPPSSELDWLRLQEGHLELAYLRHPDRVEPPDSVNTPALISPTQTLPSSSSISSELISTPTTIISPLQRRKDGHIPRPPNAFMLYRSDFWARQKETGCVERDHRHISRIAAHLWNNLADRDRQPYRKRADQLKVEHARKHPDYKYSPACRKDRLSRKRLKRDGAEEDERCKALAALVMKGIQGSELQKAVTEMDEQLEKRTLRKDEHNSGDDATGNDDNDNEYGFRQPDSKAGKKHRRSGKRPSKKSIVLPTVKIESLPTPKPSFDSPPASNSSPFVPTSDIPLLVLSASPEPCTTSEPLEVPLKAEPFNEPLIDMQSAEYPKNPKEAAAKQESIKIEQSDSFVDVHTLSNFYEGSGDRSAPIPYNPTETNSTLDLYFNCDASEYFEKQDFSIFDDSLIVESSTAAAASGALATLTDDEFAEWINYDSMPTV